MEQIVGGLVLMGIGWFGRQFWDWLQRPRLEVCLERGKWDDEFTMVIAPEQTHFTTRNLELKVRNVGGKPAVDCVARVGSLEVFSDDHWVGLLDHPKGYLPWSETDSVRKATIRPSSEAPPRHLRVLSFDTREQTATVTIRIADAAFEAESSHRMLDVPADTFASPERIRLTVWVQPEGADGRASSCELEVDMECSESDGVERHKVQVEAERYCDDADQDRGLVSLG